MNLNHSKLLNLTGRDLVCLVAGQRHVIRAELTALRVFGDREKAARLPIDHENFVPVCTYADDVTITGLPNAPDPDGEPIAIIVSKIAADVLSRQGYCHDEDWLIFTPGHLIRERGQVIGCTNLNLYSTWMEDC